MIEYIKDCGYRVLRNGKRIALNIVPAAVVATVGAAVGAAAEVLGAAYGAGTVELLTAAPAALAPYAIPILGAVAFLVGYGGLKFIRNQGQPIINVDGFEAQYEDLRNSLSSNERRRREFNLTEYNPQYWSAATDLLREKFRADETYTLERIVIRPRSLDELQRLLNAGLSRANARHLEICNTTLGAGLINELYEQVVMQDRFANLEILNLRNNQIPETSLMQLNAIGRRLKLRTLDISSNRLNSNITHETNSRVSGGVSKISTYFEQFIKDFHKNFASVKRLIISNINQNRANLGFISELWAPPSLLESIDITQNQVGIRTLAPLLRRPEFQFNVSIREILTDHNNVRSVQAAIDEREVRIQRLRTALGDSRENLIAMTTSILARLGNENEQALPNELTQFFENVIPSRGEDNQTVGDKWRALAERYNVFEIMDDVEEQERESSEEDNEENIYIQFRRSEFSYVVTINRAVRILETAQARDRINILLSYPNLISTSDTAHIVERLSSGLRTLSRFSLQDAPVIRSMNFQNMGMSSTDFSNLLAEGLGGYGTVELSLENNQINDDNIAEFARDRTLFSNLKSLNLSRTNLSADSLEALSDFCRRVQIESLNISGNTLFDPRDESSIPKLRKFITSLDYNIPTLKSLNISNIGLTSSSLSLLNPLIQNISLLEEIDACQTSIQNNMSYVNFYRNPDFLNNPFLKRFNMGKNGLNNIRTLIDRREGIVNAFKDTMPAVERELPILSTLLTKYLIGGQAEIPAVMMTALDHIVESNANELSNRKKIEILAKNIRYHRDKAHIKDRHFVFPQRVTAEEIAACKEGKLSEFWSNQVGTNPIVGDAEINNLLSRYKTFCQESRELKATEMHAFTIGENILKVYYVDDDTIRILNLATRQQRICSRYVAGNSETPFRLPILEGLAIIFEPNGNVEIHVRNKCTSYLKAYDTFSAHQLAKTRICFYEFEPVDTIRSLTTVETEVRRPTAPILNQFSNLSQAANQNEAREIPVTETRQNGLSRNIH